VRARSKSSISAAVLACAVALALAGGGCGGSKPGGPDPEYPLTPQQAALFDDGVDMLETPEALQDTWRSDWDRETHERIAQSDQIVLGDVTTVRTQEDPGQAVSYYVVISVKRTLFGSPAGHELVLTARESAAGYGQLAEQRDRLLRKSVVAFVKYAKEGELIVPHFHLAMPSQAVFAAIEQQNKNSGNEVRIITHTQDSQE
jgi:hypothetical protein